VSLLRRNRTPVPRDPSKPGPDERIFGRHYRGPSPATIGLVVALLAAIGIYLAFAKRIPFTGHGYELHATFENATTLKPGSPVRIAGVNVGKVTNVGAKGNIADVTFTVDDEGQPVHRDATITIRPRLFLEGNFFLDLHPGSPSAADLSSGGTIPVTQTATAVQLDQVLTALQANTRGYLKRTLEGFGTALTHVPTEAENVTQDPDVHGKTGAQAINETFRYGGKAGRTTSIVNQALLGEHPHDLSNLILAQRNLFTKLASTDGSLSDLITNFNTTAGALASESANLSASIHQLAPTLRKARPSLRRLDAALPPLRRLAIAARPGIRQLPATIRAGTPWLVQTKRLLRPGELGNDASLLAAAAPGLGRAAHSSLQLFPAAGVASRCVSHNLIPTGNQVIDNAGGAYPFTTGQPNYREFFYGTVNLAGESQNFDGNGQFLRFQAGGGDKFVRMRNPGGGFEGNLMWGRSASAPLGTRPRVPAGHLPPFRMDVPCYRNPVPNVNGPEAAVGPPDPKVYP
jgi:phospholipid/cholesterol/gamma-HCH transport system substrate-binding protein